MKVSDLPQANTGRWWSNMFEQHIVVLKYREDVDGEAIIDGEVLCKEVKTPIMFRPSELEWIDY